MSAAVEPRRFLLSCVVGILYQFIPTATDTGTENTVTFWQAPFINGSCAFTFGIKEDKFIE
jgi:hypothetical protein